jgi:hypothetical protein
MTADRSRFAPIAIECRSNDRSFHRKFRRCLPLQAMRPHGGQPISKRRADQLQRDLDTLRTCLHPELPPEPPAAPSAVDVEARLAQHRAEVETAEARVAEALEAAVRASNVVEQVLADFCAGGRVARVL